MTDHFNFSFSQETFQLWDVPKMEEAVYPRIKNNTWVSEAELNRQQQTVDFKETFVDKIDKTHFLGMRNRAESLQHRALNHQHISNLLKYLPKKSI